MSLSQLYNAIINEEKKGLGDTSLRIAAKNVAAAYSSQALKTGFTYLDYSKPQNRCAYLYKYAVLHTTVVKKFFRKLVRKKAIRDVLIQKPNVRICCLGGGPGTDIVGIFKALSVFPWMHKKISDTTVLDLCVGWHHSFNHIVQNLISGKVKDVPETFVKDNFKANFLEVNLLEPLPVHVMEAISNADVICMIKFVSAVLGSKESLQALKVLADLFKIGAVVLFIDNFQGKVSESIQDLSKQAGLKIILGPEVEGFRANSKTKKDIFGCEPQQNARVTVMGLIKTDEVYVNNYINPVCCNNEDNWNTESDDSDPIPPNKSLIENPSQDCDKFTQTENPVLTQLKELTPLINALSDLLSVMNKLKERQCSCECQN